MSLGDFLKDIVLPVAIGTVAGPAVGTGIGQLFGTKTALSPFLTRAGTSFLTSKVMGGRNKDALRNALLSGVGGMALDSFTGQENVASDVASTQNVRRSLDQGVSRNQAINEVVKNASPPTEQATQKIAEAFKPKTFSGELLQAAGIGEDNLLARLLNTRVGEGLTAGLLAQLLAGDDEEDTRREFERRPFGQGGPGGQLGGIRFAADGGPSDPMSFPRRTGGIDPSEGSGTKDDVPAMLMAGEFVLTKDAVKGLGDGNQRKGIQRAYNMMDNLEARA